jgi:hypothetical protein
LSLGCGSIDPVSGRTSLGYLPARGYDLLDMFELSLGLDSEFSLYAMANVEPIALGGGVYECEKLGMDGRMVGQWQEKRFDVGLIIETFVRYKKKPNWGNRYLKDPLYSPHENTLTGDGKFYDQWGFSRKLYDHEHRILDITAEANVIFLGVDVGYSLLETVDFLAGLFAIDVVSDDDWVAPYPKRAFPFDEEQTVKERTIVDNIVEK